MIEEVTINDYLDDVELVVAGGEYHRNARPLNYDWILKVREEAITRNIPFEFSSMRHPFHQGWNDYN